MNAPEELYDIACLLRDNERFVVESIRSRANNDIAAVVSTSRLHNIAGTYTGKDDPVALVRTQGNFPATGEVLSPYRIGHYVAGTMRGSHHGPLMPVKLNSTISFFDGPAIVSAAAFCVHEGKFTEPVDAFDHPFWDWVRNNVSVKAAEIRNQGFSGPAMLPYSELEYGGVVEKMGQLDARFHVRKEKRRPPPAAARPPGGRLLNIAWESQRAPVLSNGITVTYRCVVSDRFLRFPVGFASNGSAGRPSWRSAS